MINVKDKRFCTKLFEMKDSFPFSIFHFLGGREGERGSAGGPCPITTSISKPNKVQQFQFQTSGILLFMGVQKLNGLKISRFSPCMLQFLNHSRLLIIFSNYIRGIDHFTLDLLKRSDTYLTSHCGPSERRPQ